MYDCHHPGEQCAECSQHYAVRQGIRTLGCHTHELGLVSGGGVVKDIMGVVNDIMGVVVYIKGVSWCPIEGMIVTLVISVLNAAIIMLLGKVYDHLAAIRGYNI